MEKVTTAMLKFSDFLKHKYGSKVYKIPVNLPVSCPNRGKGGSGCTFCDDVGAGFELNESSMTIEEQVRTNVAYIGKNYNAQKFIIYFQNYSNTYVSLSVFEGFLQEVKKLQKEYDIVALYISTRPDCIREDYLESIKQIFEDSMDIVIELGLQTVNYKTLKILNRGHSLAEFIDAVGVIGKYKYQICAHCILDLPFDEDEDVIETAKIISALGIEQVKCHSLYILENTVLGELYLKGELRTLEIEDFIRRTRLFLEYLNPKVVIQRLIGRAPKERSLFCNYNMSWWKIQDKILESLELNDSYQGKKFNYLNGKALKF